MKVVYTCELSGSKFFGLLYLSHYFQADWYKKKSAHLSAKQLMIRGDAGEILKTLV